MADQIPVKAIKDPITGLVTGLGEYEAGDTISKSVVGLGNVTNDAQAKASIYPNTVPAAGRILVGQTMGKYESHAMSGDASISESGLFTIGNGAVTNAKQGHMAAGTIKGNKYAANVTPQDLTPAEARSVLGLGTAAVVNTGTGPSDAILGNDTRLSDSREWTAATVDQAEAEAGTATTRRAWTAQRVRQAIAAWWLTASSAFGRTLANAVDAAAGRTALGLGTAATATVTTHPNDTTAGRITKVGDFGWGGEPQTLTGSWNDLGGNSRLVKGLLSATTDGPFSGVVWLFGSYIRLEPNYGYFLGVTAAGANSQVFLRGLSGGTWRSWIEIPREGFDARFAALTASIVNTPSIRFPATQVASSDPNTLDDYEEGTFTPVARGQASAGVGTYGVQLGKYTKIGRKVFFQIFITWTAHTGTGNLQITGLPFITSSDINSHSYFTVVPSDLTYSGDIAANALPGQDLVQILSFASNSSITQVSMDSSAGLRISGHYFV